MTRSSTSVRAAGPRRPVVPGIVLPRIVLPWIASCGLALAGVPSGLVTGAAVLAGGAALAGCGGAFSDEPKSAEDLVETIFREAVLGHQDRVWELLTAEHRAEFELFVQRDREFIRRNPGNENKADMYSMPLEEFMTAPIRQVWVRANSPGNHLFQGARITDRFADPQRPTDVVFDVENPRGQKWRLVVRPEGSRWRLQRTMPLQLDVR